jgi:hypothetical protein
VERRWPWGRSAVEYRVDDIAEFRPARVGTRTYALHMFLKNQQYVRLHLGGTSDVGGIRAQAAQMAQKVGLAPPPREIRL